MLSEDRIKVMTKLAVFEKEHGKENEIASHYYKSDYISYHMIWTAIATTGAYLLMLVLYFAVNFDNYMENMHKMKLGDMAALGKNMIFLYIVLMVLMLMSSFFFYRKKYRSAQKGLEEYCRRLHDLERIYNSRRPKKRTTVRQED